MSYILPSDFEVFISHAGEDKFTIALPLYRSLCQLGVKAFLDATELPSGELSIRNIRKHLETTPVLVFILSPDFIAKKWPMEELTISLNRVNAAESRGYGKPMLVPVFYRLSVEQCQNNDVFSQSYQVFETHGFFQRNAEGETSEAEIMNALSYLKGYAGIRNDFGATNEESCIMNNKRRIFVQIVANKIREVVLKIRPHLPKPLMQTPSAAGPLSTLTTTHRTSDQIQPNIYLPPGSPSQSYVPSFGTVPEKPHRTHLDFSSFGTGNPQTNESELKEKLMEPVSTLCGEVTGFEGRIVSVHGVSGIGKTTAMIGIGWESDVREHFSDGIFFIPCGEKVTEASLLGKLAEVVSDTGGVDQARLMINCSSFEKGVERAMYWFMGRKVLFLLDDLRGYLQVLRKLAREPATVVVTTPFPDIAYDAGCAVQFKPNKPISRCILLKYAGEEDPSRARVMDYGINDILKRCKGLPSLLAIAGRNIWIIRQGDGICPGESLSEAIGKYADGLRRGDYKLARNDVELHKGGRDGLEQRQEENRRSGRPFKPIRTLLAKRG